MKKLLYFLLAIVLFGTACKKSSTPEKKPDIIEEPTEEPETVMPVMPFGVNLAGAEFGTALPGEFGKDYTYPTVQELEYFRAKGLKLIRLPFKWERLQPQLGGALNQVELNRIIQFVDLAQTKGMWVILDLHNYGRRSISGTSHIIGSAAVSVSDIKSVWGEIANVFKDKKNIWGYGIMNEPHGMLATATWASIAQEIIIGIRAKDNSTTIIVGGDDWSSAARWMTSSDNLKNLADPYNNLIFEAHVYFDKDASGTYKNTYDLEEATANTGVQRVTPFVNWLKTNNLRGFIGEYGVPNNDIRWFTVLDNFLNHLKANCINGTYWAAGPWWGNNPLSVEPQNGGTDKPQMIILQNYKELDAELCK